MDVYSTYTSACIYISCPCYCLITPLIKPHLPGRIECELPNNRLDKYVGLLAMESLEEEQDIAQYALDNDKILLRVGFLSRYVIK